MKTNAILFCLCIGMFAQCDRAGDRGIMPEPGSGEVIEGITEEPPQTPEEPNPEETEEFTSEKWARGMDASYDEVCEKAACPSPAKTGEAYDITGKWKLMMEISGNDTVDRSCEEIVYHFKADGTLSVAGSTEDVDYAFEAISLCPSCDPAPRPNLRMGDTEVFCIALYTKMILYPQYEQQFVPTARWPVFEINNVFLRIE
ncbi:MAG: hypothetical protein LBP50_06825 [Tannerella sp.]|jgi:hypothetical protein|nr:hypothetical protein [Tannerella sp.]